LGLYLKRLIPAGEQYGSLTHIATMESESLCGLTKADAFVELESLICAGSVLS
jgi:hypothetical protein